MMKRRMGSGKKELKEAPKEEGKILKLPSHITIEILSSLPVKTIAHCACVCKAWHTLVSDPGFLQIHLSKSPVNLMLVKKHCCRLIEFEKDFYKRKMSDLWDEAVATDFINLDVVSSCNGLLCLEDEVNGFCVWNPVISDYILVPDPNIQSGYTLAMAFGFCPSTNVYKLVRMVKCCSQAPMAPSNKTMCEVYTLGTNACWRTIEDVPEPTTAKDTDIEYYKKNCTVPFNGAVHWFCNFIINDEKFPLWICAFRIGDEKWDPILLPPSLLEGLKNFSLSTLKRLQLGVLENCLSIFDHSQVSVLNVWMMKDYGVRESWTKRWSIEQTQISSDIRVHSLWPLKLTNDGELLMFYHTNPTLVCFDPEKRRLTQKEKIYDVWKRGRGQSMAYVVSLISPTQVDGRMLGLKLLV